MGFVSNSSSTSFCIYGKRFDSDEIPKLLEKLQITNTYDISDRLKELGYKLQSQQGQYDTVYVGKEWKNIGLKETGKQFMDNIKTELADLLNEKDVNGDTYEEGWFNG